MIRSYSEEEKMAYVEEFKNSELGVTTFARQNGIPESTFRGWLKDISDLSFGMINLKPTPSAGIKKEKLNNIETEIVRSELNKDEKCPICGGTLKKVSENLVWQELVYHPGYFTLRNHFQTTCKCENCGM